MTPQRFFLFIIAMLALLHAHAQSTQTVKGTIYDNASQAPLMGATIILVSNPAIGTTSDINGQFRITGVPLGRQSFRITYIGYEDRMINDVIVTSGKEVNLDISIQEALNTLNELTVVYDKSKDKTRTVNDMVQVSSRSFNIEDTKRFAGSLGDPSRMVANFAGVVSGNDSRNDIVVRGNSPSGMLWQMEGLNIPNPNHFGNLGATGGPVSMLNNNNIDKSDFMTSAFPAQYGNALAGVFDLRLRNGNREKSEFVAQMGFNGFELGAEGPLGKKKQISYLVNYRYSTLGVFQKMGINFGTGNATPLYQDLNFKVSSNIGRKGKLSLFGLWGTSSIGFMGADVDTTSTDMYSGDPYGNEQNDYGTSVTGLSYEHQLTERTFTKLTLGYSTTMQLYDYDSISNIDGSVMNMFNEDFKTQKMSGVWSLMHKVNAKNNFQAGVTYDHTFFNMYQREMEGGTTPKIYVDHDGDFGLLQSYAQWKHRFNNKLSAVGGVHFQYLTSNASAAVEPRLSFRYTLNEKHAVGIGYGLHHQAQSIYTYNVETSTNNNVAYTNKNLDFTRNQHLVVTYDWNITSNLRLKAEAYYQHLDRVPVEYRPTIYSALNTGGSFDMPYVDSLVNNGTGRNYGVELTVERFFSKGFYFLVTGSLFDSKYKGSDGVERNTAFNTGYVLNVLAGKDIRLKNNSVLALNLKIASVGGRYLTPIDLERSIATGSTEYKLNLAFTEKQPAYFRADFRVAYRKEFKKSTLEIAVDLQNVTNQKNIFSQNYNPRTQKIVRSYQQGFFPVPLVRYTF